MTYWYKIMYHNLNRYQCLVVQMLFVSKLYRWCPSSPPTTCPQFSRMLFVIPLVVDFLLQIFKLKIWVIGKGSWQLNRITNHEQSAIRHAISPARGKLLNIASFCDDWWRLSLMPQWFNGACKGWSYRGYEMICLYWNVFIYSYSERNWV